MDNQLLKKIWLEEFPSFCLEGIDNRRFLNGITTSNMNQPASNIVKTCWLNPKGVLKSLLEIHYIENQLLILVLEGNVNEIRKHFEDIIFPADKVNISSIKDTIRLQQVDDNSSWRKEDPILFNQNECDEYITQNSFHVLNKNDLKIWKIKQAIPILNYEIDGINNPLELGLVDLIDFKKGCFLGQEIMARLKNISSLKQEIRVWRSGKILNNLNNKNEKIYCDDEKGKIVGQITSFAKINEEEYIGLALVKKKYLDQKNNFFSNQFGILELNRSVGSIFL